MFVYIYRFLGNDTKSTAVKLKPSFTSATDRFPRGVILTVALAPANLIENRHTLWRK